jgi:hypothetical protein
VIDDTWSRPETQAVCELSAKAFHRPNILSFCHVCALPVAWRWYQPTEPFFLFSDVLGERLSGGGGGR